MAREPAAVFARLRAAGGWAYSTRWGGFWSAFRYADVLRVAADPQTFVTSIQNLVPPSPRSGLPRPPLQLDPPAHARFRRAINPFFEPDRVRLLLPELRQLAGRFLYSWVQSGAGDGVADYAAHLAVRAVARLLGLPEAIVDDAQKISSRYVEAVAASDVPRAAALSADLDDLARQAVRNTLQKTGGAPDSPVVVLWHRRAELGIGFDDVAGFVRALLVGADRSTTNALGSAIWHLACHPSLQQWLRFHPGRVADAVDELVRLYPPALATARTAVRDTVVGHQAIRAGQVVAMVLFAANRDPGVFHDPDRFQLDRPHRANLSFGHGIHKCPGQHLARLLMGVALEALLTSTRDFCLAGPVIWRRWPEFGPARLPLTLRSGPA
ncbi:MAG: cytochrome P450 [Armatimonadota bacterium]|nr:cytochrome P450 [Armatimonadota bacterium]